MTKPKAPMKLDFHTHHLVFKAVPGWGVAQQKRTLSLSVCAKPRFPPLAPSKTKIQPGTIGSVCPAQGDSVTYGWNEHLLAISAFHFERDMSSNSAPHPLTESSQESSRPDRELHTFLHQKPVPLSRVAHSLRGFWSDQNEQKRVFSSWIVSEKRM